MEKDKIMTEFNKSKWANAEFGKEYIDNADIYIVERRRLLEILKSFYRHFLNERGQNRILDLGCGDGIITQELSLLFYFAVFPHLFMSMIIELRLLPLLVRLYSTRRGTSG